MINEILKIRTKQLFRIIVELGLFRAVFLLGAFSVAMLIIFTVFKEDNYREIVLAAIALLILVIHIKRNDKAFINTYAPKPYWLFFVEYLILAFPLIIILAYFQLWLYLVSFVLLITIAPFANINIKKKSINSVLQRAIPNDNFEWKAGVRKNLFILLPIWLVGFTGSFFIASVPIIMFFISFIIINFYEKFEPIQIIIVDELDAKSFLLNKISKHLKLFMFVMLPLVMAFIIFNPQYYYIAIIEFIVFAILLTYTILLKYAFYQPNVKSGAMQVFTMIGVICIIIPVFIPVLLVLSIKLLYKANKNLKFYMHDFN